MTTQVSDTDATITYVLPIKADAPPSDELTDYLRSISARCPVIVVDGSDPDTFASAHARWSGFARHVVPAESLRCRNGKVWGALTGLTLVDTPLVVIADDDVRYDGKSLERVQEALADADLVVPQNYFEPSPWHARWDSARSLLNRISGGDYPGTLAMRMSALPDRRYDGNVLFENLELMRTVAVTGGRIRRVPDLFVLRRPPTTHHFVHQRVRQAYDEFARPLRLAAWLAVVPLVAAARHRPRLLAGAAAATVAGAEVGRRRAGARDHFHWTCSLWAPVWVLERGVCAWLALAQRFRGGVPYSGERLATAAHSCRELRRHDVGSLA